MAAAKAGPILRDLVTRFANHPRHQYVVAVTLASLPGVTDTATWSESPNPVLRRVAAQVTDPVSDGQLNEEFQAFLADEDGYVRETALTELANAEFPNLESVLDQLTTQERPGWKCQWCATQNPPGTSVCTAEDCHIAAPNPAAKERELLERVRR